MWRASGALELHLYVPFFYFINSLINYELLRNHKQWHTLQYDEGHFTKEDQLSWKWKFVRSWSLEGIGVLHFMMLPFLILIAYFTGPNFWFRCDRRGVCTWVRWCLQWQSVVEVLKCGGLHLVITEVIPVGGSEDKKVDFISVKLTSG